MTENHSESYLLNHLEEAYQEERKKFEEARENENNKRLLERAQAIVQAATKGKKDNIKTEEAGSVTPAGVTEEGEAIEDTLTITPADIKYGGRIHLGESVAVVSTDYFPYEEKDLAGRKVNIALSLEETSFTKVTGQGTNRRLGDIAIVAKVVDEDGVAVATTLAGLGPSIKEKDKYLLIYGFGSPVKHGSEDYKKVEDMIFAIERQVGIAPANPSAPMSPEAPQA